MTVVTLAGATTSGNSWIDGTYTSATFGQASYLALDATGDLLIADMYASHIRKISSLGVTTTVAGSAVFQHNDGTGTSASFYYPRGAAADSNGILYVTDYYNHKIRAVVISTGVVTTVVGTGAATALDGVGTSATVSYPFDVTVDSNGNLYSCDTVNSAKIRKITSTLVVSTFAGTAAAGYQDGTGTSAYFATTYCGIAADKLGNVFVADFSNNRIRKISVTAVVTTVAGQSAGFTDGSGTNAKFSGPYSIAVDAHGTLFVGDWSNFVIRMVTSAGVVTTFAGATAGGSSDGSGLSTRFSPISVKVDTAMNVYVMDYLTYKIRKISQSSKYKLEYISFKEFFF